VADLVLVLLRRWPGGAVRPRHYWSA